MSKVLLVLLVVAGLQVVRVASFNLTMSPEHQHVSPPNQDVSFMCSADVALAGCEFRWWDGDYNTEGPVLELSKGSESWSDPANLNPGLTGYSYSGRGLEAGDCGVTLQLLGEKLLMVSCRVRTEDGGWKYAWSDLFAKHWAALPHTLTPREAIVLPGGEVTYMLKANEPLAWCSFDLPDLTELNFKDGAESSDSNGRHLYFGAGLESGECGLRLSNVTQTDNGHAKGYLRTSDKNDYRFMPLIVANRPIAPTMSVAYNSSKVTAICVVKESLPIVDIAWFLDDVTVREDDVDDSSASPGDEWRWPWVGGSVQQSVTLQLLPQDDGKTLKCRVSHVTLDQPLEVTEIIAVPDPE